MVLAELGGSISAALQRMKNRTIVDERALNECLNDINRALLDGNVQFELVKDMANNIKKTVDLDHLAAGHNKRKIIEKAVFNELCRMLYAGEKPGFTPVKGKTSVVMFVGLQGSGKTTTCTKYASYYQKKGFKPGVVCADTFRAGAFDQLKQNAAKARIPCYGSYKESDPLKVAVEGVERFKNAGVGVADLIIVDTSGRHKQEAALLEEMRQLSEATKPDLVVFVMDGSIGQNAFAQAQAFKQCIAEIGAVIITKMDGGHAKGGGALSAVAATNSPVIFIGTGEHIGDFQEFDVKTFVSRLLGWRDLSRFVDSMKDNLPSTDDGQEPLQVIQNLMSEKNATLGSMFKMFSLITGPFSQVFSGFSAELMPNGNQISQASLKQYMTIMDSMTREELDFTTPKLMTESRMRRVAYGSGCRVQDVMDVLAHYKRFLNVWPKMKKRLGPLSGTTSAAQLRRMLPPGVLQHIGGMSNLMGMFGGQGM